MGPMERGFSFCRDGITISGYGLLMYGDMPAGETSAEVFAKDFVSGVASFDRCTGAYRMQLAWPDGKTVYFGDNAGMMRYYIHKPTASFHTTLAQAAAQGDRTPNFSAVTQLLYYGCVYGAETIIQSVQRSDPNCYYVVEQGQLTVHDKRLTPLEELETSGDALRSKCAAWRWRLKIMRR